MDMGVVALRDEAQRDREHSIGSELIVASVHTWRFVLENPLNARTLSGSCSRLNDKTRARE